VNRITSKFYSWSDWISYEGNPVATGEEAALESAYIMSIECVLIIITGT